MSDHDHVQACAAARLQGLKTFFLSRGHSADEADDLAKRHLRGETVTINEPPGIGSAAIQPQERIAEEPES